MSLLLIEDRFSSVVPVEVINPTSEADLTNPSVLVLPVCLTPSTCHPATVCGVAHSSNCHSYLQCKYGEQCSGRDLKMTPPRVSVMKLINRGTGVEQVLTMRASLITSLSSQSGCPIFPLPFSPRPNKAQLHGDSFIHYRHGPWPLLADS